MSVFPGRQLVTQSSAIPAEFCPRYAAGAGPAAHLRWPRLDPARCSAL